MGRLEPTVAEALVLHRGFHSVADSSNRPIENSLPAYENAWAGGCCHCECDVVVTRDGYVVCNHDSDLQRLALFGGGSQITDSITEMKSHLLHRPLGNLTFREIATTPLKSGVRPPLLKEVLQGAAFIADDARLIVELKAEKSPDRSVAAVSRKEHRTNMAVLKLLKNSPHLIRHVAVVMCFDIHSIHTFARLWRKDVLPVMQKYNAQRNSAELMARENGLSLYDNAGSVGNFAYSSDMTLLQSPPAVIPGGHGSGSAVGTPGSVPARSHSTTQDGRAMSKESLASHGLVEKGGGPTNAGSNSSAYVDIQTPFLMLLCNKDLTVRGSFGEVLNLDELSGDEERLDKDIDRMLKVEDGLYLDGVYIEWTPELTGRQAPILRRLCERCIVGVWQYAHSEDTYIEARALVDLGVRFVNTDLPRGGWQGKLEPFSSDSKSHPLTAKSKSEDKVSSTHKPSGCFTHVVQERHATSPSAPSSEAGRWSCSPGSADKSPK